MIDKVKSFFKRIFSFFKFLWNLCPTKLVKALYVLTFIVLIVAAIFGGVIGFIFAFYVLCLAWIVGLVIFL